MKVVLDKNRHGEWQYVIEDMDGNIVALGFKSYEEAFYHMSKLGA